MRAAEGRGARPAAKKMDKRTVHIIIGVASVIVVAVAITLGLVFGLKKKKTTPAGAKTEKVYATRVMGMTQRVPFASYDNATPVDELVLMANVLEAVLLEKYPRLAIKVSPARVSDLVWMAASGESTDGNFLAVLPDTGITCPVTYTGGANALNAQGWKAGSGTVSATMDASLFGGHIFETDYPLIALDAALDDISAAARGSATPGPAGAPLVAVSGTRFAVARLAKFAVASCSSSGLGSGGMAHSLGSKAPRVSCKSCGT